MKIQLLANNESIVENSIINLGENLDFVLPDEKQYLFELRSTKKEQKSTFYIVDGTAKIDNIVSGTYAGYIVDKETCNAVKIGTFKVRSLNEAETSHYVLEPTFTEAQDRARLDLAETQLAELLELKTTIEELATFKAKVNIWSDTVSVKIEQLETRIKALETNYDILQNN